VVKELLQRVEEDSEDPVALSTARLLFETATLRSGYSLDDQVGFAERIEGILRKSLGITSEAQVDEELEIAEDDDKKTVDDDVDDDKKSEEDEQEQLDVEEQNHEEL